MSDASIAELKDILLKVQSDVVSTSAQVSSAVSDIKEIKENQNAFMREFADLKNRWVELENRNKTLE